MSEKQTQTRLLNLMGVEAAEKCNPGSFIRSGRPRPMQTEHSSRDKKKKG
jgi:hypothetical protein